MLSKRISQIVMLMVGMVLLGSGCITIKYYDDGRLTRTTMNGIEVDAWRSHQILMSLETDEVDGEQVIQGGTWEFVGKPMDEDWVQVDMDVNMGGEGKGRWGRTFKNDEIERTLYEKIDGGYKVAYEIRRDAGVLTLSGEQVKKKSEGDIVFVANESYVGMIKETMGDDVGEWQVFDAFWHNLDGEDVKEYVASGIKDIHFDSVLRMRKLGVDGDDVRVYLKIGELSCRDIIEMKEAGVSEHYVEDCVNAGYAFSKTDYISLVRAGVSRSFAERLKEATYDFSADELVQLARSGVSSTFAKNLREGGYELGANELAQLARNGVSSTFAKNVRKAGYEASVDELIEFARNGVSSTYIKNLYKAGYRFGLNEIVTLARNGVSSTTAARYKEAGYEFSCDEMVALSRNGVSSSTARRYREAGYVFNCDELVKLTRAGVSSHYIERAKKSGCEFDCDELIQLVQAGVSSHYLEDIRGSGLDLTVDEIITYARSGVKAEKIGELKKL